MPVMCCEALLAVRKSNTREADQNHGRVPLHRARRNLLRTARTIFCPLAITYQSVTYRNSRTRYDCGASNGELIFALLIARNLRRYGIVPKTCLLWLLARSNC
jgi:hypothetical protein